MLNIPQDSIYYAKLTYKDGSVRLIKFCKDNKILAENFIFPIENSIYDLDKEIFVSYDCNTKIEVTKERPELEVLHEFAHQFI